MTLDPSTLGYISMRNQDGTQYFCEDEFGQGWGEYRFRTQVSYARFLGMEAGAEASRERDNPDNGFYGLYNLKFTPLGQSSSRGVPCQPQTTT